MAPFLDNWNILYPTDSVTISAQLRVWRRKSGKGVLAGKYRAKGLLCFSREIWLWLTCQILSQVSSGPCDQFKFWLITQETRTVISSAVKPTFLLLSEMNCKKSHPHCISFLVFLLSSYNSSVFQKAHIWNLAFCVSFTLEIWWIC